VIRHAQGEPSFCDGLPDHELVQVGDNGSGGWDRGEESFLGRALGRRRWLWNGLGDLGKGSGCTGAADAGGWIEAAIEERDALVEAERAARRLVGHGDTRVGGV
jgi:hypothetical protein